MASTRLLISDQDGAIRAQLLDSPRLASISPGSWNVVELTAQLELLAQGQSVQAITLRSAVRSLAGVRGPVTVRRALATEGALPRRLRSGATSPHA